MIADGSLHGVLLNAPRGEGGFGYDPLFYIPELDRTVAQLSVDEKRPHLASRQGLGRAD